MSRGRGQRPTFAGYTAMLWPADPADDWHPCYPRHTVQVRVFDGHAGRWRVAVWGADDFGLERDFASEADQRALIRSLPNPISKAWLRGQGFGNA